MKDSDREHASHGGAHAENGSRLRTVLRHPATLALLVGVTITLVDRLTEHLPIYLLIILLALVVGAFLFGVVNVVRDTKEWLPPEGIFREAWTSRRLKIVGVFLLFILVGLQAFRVYNQLTPDSLLSTLFEHREGTGGVEREYDMLAGVGNVFASERPDVVAIDSSGKAVILELDSDARVKAKIEAEETWDYDHLVGLGNIDDDEDVEVLTTRGRPGWIMDYEDLGEQESSRDLAGRTWSYDFVTAVADVDGSGEPEILGINLDGDDELLYIEDGHYTVDDNRSETVQEAGHYDFVTGIGDIDGDEKPEVLAVIDGKGLLLHFDRNAEYTSTELDGSWDYEYLTSLYTFGDEEPGMVLAVRSDEACILSFNSNGTYSVDDCHT